MIDPNDLLDQIRDAADTIDAATGRRDDLIRRAMLDKLPRADIAAAARLTEARLYQIGDADARVYLHVSPAGFANQYTVLVAPADRYDDLVLLAERMTTQNGQYGRISRQAAAGIARTRPERLYGVDGGGYEPSQEDIDDHTAHRARLQRGCPVCYPPAPRVTDLLDACEAATLRRLGEQG